METGTYDVNWFIKKFEAIPEDKWVVGVFQEGDKCCAQGHCGMNENNCWPIWNGERPDHEGYALYRFFPDEYMLNVAGINNGQHPDYQQSTPKARILAALYDIKAKIEKETVAIAGATVPTVTERIVYVTVDEKVKELGEASLCLN